MSKSSWYWAAKVDAGPVGQNFIIANGQDDLWSRVRRELAQDERVYWNKINDGDEPSLADMFDLVIHIAPIYGVDHNKFVFEAAQIPVFAEFLRTAKHDLCNYVSNPIVPDMVIRRQPYSGADKNRLGHIASRTLNIEPDWF